MQTGVRAPGASSVSSAAAGVLVTVSDFAGVVGLSGDAPCHDRSGVSANIKAVGRSPQACKCMCACECGLVASILGVGATRSHRGQARVLRQAWVCMRE